MGLLIAGIVESLVAIILGAILLFAEPSVSAVWGLGLVILGLITGVLTLSFARGPKTAKVEPDEEVADGAAAPEDDAQPAQEAQELRSLPEYHPEANAGLMLVSRHLPERIDALQQEVSKARWRYKAKEIQSRAAELAELVLQGPKSAGQVDERPHQLRRLLELFMLSQGYEAWANGTSPVFHVERYRRVLNAQDISSRQADLTAESNMLWQEISQGVPSKSSEEDNYRQTIDIRIRLERITAAEERLEDIEILRMGYESLLEESQERRR
jgi:hypothetical protein